MHKFFENTVQSKYIKALLYNSALPNIDTLGRGDIAIKSHRYLLNRRIYECTKTGEYLSLDEDEEAKFKFISDFDLGSFYPKVNKIYTSNTDYYDSQTHEQLYKYLKFYKDIYKINLLPFYNIYSNRFATNINITRDENDRGYIYYKNYKTTKLLKIKIRFNRTYTIAIDCNTEVWVAPVFMQNDSLLTVPGPGDTELDVTDEFISEKDYVTKYTNLNFNHPITFKVESTNEDFIKYEDYLYLVIKLPLDNESSITVLDGDYTSIAKNPIINMGYINNEIKEENLNDTLITNLTLLQMNTGTSYPYSNRLVEYLLFNPITPFESITGNITRVQEASYNFHGDSITEGSWNSYMRVKLFNAYLNSNRTRHIDINGFVDKDMESYLNSSVR